LAEIPVAFIQGSMVAKQRSSGLMLMYLNFKSPSRFFKLIACFIPDLLKTTPGNRPAKMPFSLAMEWACRIKITVVTTQGYRDLRIHTC
jgi:hypothetical protein